MWAWPCSWNRAMRSKHSVCLTRSLILAMASKSGTSSLFHEDPGMMLNLGGKERRGGRGRRERARGKGGRRGQEERGREEREMESINIASSPSTPPPQPPTPPPQPPSLTSTSLEPQSWPAFSCGIWATPVHTKTAGVE